LSVENARANARLYPLPTGRDDRPSADRRQVQPPADVGLDGGYRLAGVDHRDVLLALEDLEDRPSLAVVLAQPDGQRLRVVVGPPDQRAAAHVAHSGVPRPAGDQVVVQAATGAEPAGEHPAHDLLIRKVEV